MPFRHLITLIALAAILGLPAAAHARSSQFTMFEAPRELLSDDGPLRAQTFDEIHGFGVRWLRVVLYWQSVAPEPDSRSVPVVRRARSRRLPGLRPLRPPHLRGAGPRAAYRPDRVGAGAALGDTRSERPRHAPQPDAIRPLHDRGGPALPPPGVTVDGVERAQPSRLPGSPSTPATSVHCRPASTVGSYRPRTRDCGPPATATTACGSARRRPAAPARWSRL